MENCSDDQNELFCRECGNSMMIQDDGVSHHLTEDGEVDYDMDGDHVAVAEDEADL